MRKSIPPKSPDRSVHKTCGYFTDLSKAYLPAQTAFVAEGELFGGEALRSLIGAWRTLNQKPDLSEPDFQQPCSEPVFPGAQDSGERQRSGPVVTGSDPANQRQHVSRTARGDQAEAGRWQ